MNTNLLTSQPRATFAAPLIFANFVRTSRRAFALVSLLASLWVPAGIASAATPQIVSGGGANCVLRQDGRVSCWGFNGDGKASPPTGPFEQISLSAGSGCGLRASGQVECWGAGQEGFDVPAGTYTQVDAGDSFQCALRDDQKIVCWGALVGSTYIPFSEDTDQFVKMSTGWRAVCGIRTDGTLACAGYGPLATPGGSYIQVSAPNTNDVGCAVRSDGQAVCWGHDAYGQIATPNGEFLTAAAGLYHACGLRTDGTISCWGYFGNQDYRQYFPPTGQYTSLGVDTHDNCALRVDGVTVCWGVNQAGSSPKLGIEPKTILAAEVSVPYSAQLSMVDEGTIWTYAHYVPIDPILTITSGQLPQGFSLSASGQLQGTAIASGEWPITVLAQDDNGFEVEREIAFTVVAQGEDVTPPEIIPAIDGLRQTGDWYSSDVIVEWQVNDPESGAISKVGCETLVIDHDTSLTGTSIICSARSTGGVSSETVELRRDATAPTVRITSVESRPDYGEGYFTFHFAATDAISEVAFTECSIDDGGFAFCGMNINYASGSETIGPLSAGPHRFDARARDNAGNFSDPVSYNLNVGTVDTSAPVIVGNVSGTVGNNGWYVGDVSITWSVTDPESSISSSSGCNDSTLTTDTGATSFTCSATSTGGSSSDSLTVKLDKTLPALSPSVSPNPLLLNAVATASAGATDALSGVAQQDCAALATASIGSKSAVCTATDSAGNTASASLGYRIIYKVQGSSNPYPESIYRLPIHKALGFSWRLTDANDAPVDTLGSAVVVTVGPNSCPWLSNYIYISPSGGGNTALQRLGNGYYAINWRAPKSYKGLCADVGVRLDDGQQHSSRRYRFD